MLIHPNTAKAIIDFITDFNIASRNFFYDALGDCTHTISESKILTLAFLTNKPLDEVKFFCENTLDTIDDMQFCKMMVSADIEIMSNCEEPLYYNEDWDDFEEEDEDVDDYTLREIEGMMMTQIISESLGLNTY